MSSKSILSDRHKKFAAMVKDEDLPVYDKVKAWVRNSVDMCMHEASSLRN
jgi:hypothetical protein